MYLYKEVGSFSVQWKIRETFQSSIHIEKKHYFQADLKDCEKGI